MVFCFLQVFHAGELLELLGHLAAELSGGIQAGTGCGTADGELAQAREGSLNALDAELHLAGVAAELLAQGDWGGVHEVGAAGLDDVREFLRLLGQGLVQDLQARDEVIDGSFRSRHVGSGGEGVIGGLAHVDVIVRVNLYALLMHQGGDDLVGVHIGRGAGAGLEYVDGEGIVVLAIRDFLCGGDNGVCLFCIQAAGVLVDLCACSLEQAKRTNLRIFQAAAGNREIVYRTLGLCAPQGISGNFNLAHSVMFGTVFGHENHLG